MNVWILYEQRKRELVRKLEAGQITHAEYDKGIQKICKELNI